MVETAQRLLTMLVGADDAPVPPLVPAPLATALRDPAEKSSDGADLDGMTPEQEVALLHVLE